MELEISIVAGNGDTAVSGVISLKATLALGTVSPFASITVPAMLPICGAGVTVSCPFMGADPASIPASTTAKHIQIRCARNFIPIPYFP